MIVHMIYPASKRVVTTEDVPAQEDIIRDIFRAANRIGSLDEDVQSLPEGWLRDFRRMIDQYGLPSMSVGDVVELYTDRGDFIIGYRCAPFGWDTLTSHDPEFPAPHLG